MAMTVGTEDRLADLLSGIRVHDVDTHVTEPTDLWTSRMSSSRWGDAIPRTEHDPVSGKERWFVDGRIGWVAFSSPRGFDEATVAGASEPVARLAWMDKHGLFSQVLYPNLVGFCPRLFMDADHDFGIECLRVYNDFQSEFASVAPDRLIAMANLPWWDLDAAVAELERC